MKSVLNSYMLQFAAIVKGDDVEVQRQKSWRKSESALKSEISTQNGKTVDKEDAVDDAKEYLNLARVNFGKVEHNREAYINNLIEAQNKVLKAEKDLKQHLQLIEFLETSLKELGKEVKEEK